MNFANNESFGLKIGTRGFSRSGNPNLTSGLCFLQYPDYGRKDFFANFANGESFGLKNGTRGFNPDLTSDLCFLQYPIYGWEVYF